MNGSARPTWSDCLKALEQYTDEFLRNSNVQGVGLQESTPESDEDCALIVYLISDQRPVAIPLEVEIETPGGETKRIPVRTIVQGRLLPE